MDFSPWCRTGAAEINSPDSFSGGGLPAHRPRAHGASVGTAAHLAQPAASPSREAQPGKPWYKHAADAPVPPEACSRAVVPWGPLLLGLQPPLDPQTPKTLGSWAQSFLAWHLPVSSASVCICPVLLLQHFLGQALHGAGDSEIRHGHCPSGSSRSRYFKGEDRPPLLPCPAHPGLSCRVLFPSFSKLRNIFRRDSFPTAEPNIRDASGLCLHPEKHHVSTSQNERKATAKYKLLRNRR